MKREIERKFLVRRMRGRLAAGVAIDQGYLCFAPEVRVRILDRRGFITVKSRGLLSREEFEYRIPRSDAKRLLSLCPWRIRKKRHRVGRFCVDVYEGKLHGLTLAEIELERKGLRVKLPPGMDGVEVTFDPRFRNRRLVKLTRRAFLRFVGRVAPRGAV